MADEPKEERSREKPSAESELEERLPADDEVIDKLNPPDEDEFF